MTETPEAPETGVEETATPEPGQLPADHPLVRTLTAQKEEISQLKNHLAAAEPQNPQRVRELKDLKAKAKRLDELEEASKSEAQRAADRISKAEAEAASVPTKVSEALKTHLVDLHGIDTEDAELFLTATEPDLLLKQVARLLGQSDKRRRNRVPRIGENPTAAESPVREFTRQLFGSDQ